MNHVDKTPQQGTQVNPFDVLDFAAVESPETAAATVAEIWNHVTCSDADVLIPVPPLPPGPVFASEDIEEVFLFAKSAGITPSSVMANPADASNGGDTWGGLENLGVNLVA